MNFQALKKHLDENGCSIDHLADNVYMAKNCIGAEHCIVEDLPFYNIGTLAHYFYQLSIPIPESLDDLVHVYTNWREHVKEVGFVPKNK